MPTLSDAQYGLLMKFLHQIELNILQKPFLMLANIFILQQTMFLFHLIPQINLFINL